MEVVAAMLIVPLFFIAMKPIFWCANRLVDSLRGNRE